MSITEIKQKEIVAKYLTGKTTTELGREYNVNSGAISYVLKKNSVNTRSPSIAHRKYQINENFFDTIDTQEKAYFMGLLYADGNNNIKKGQIRLELVESDKNILEKLSKFIYKEHRPLSLRTRKNINFKGKTYKAQNMCLLSIYSKHICLTLEKHGMIPAKSLKLIFPSCVPCHLIRHFIRGYFDGDGSLSISCKGQIKISILGTSNFCNSIKNATDKIGVKSSVRLERTGQTVHCFIIHGNNAGRIFLKYIYEGADIFLERKYTKYEQIIKLIPPENPETCSLCDSKYYSHSYCKKHHYQFIGKLIRRERYMKFHK